MAAFSFAVNAPSATSAPRPSPLTASQLSTHVRQLVAHVRHVVLTAVSNSMDVNKVVDAVMRIMQDLPWRDTRFPRYALVKLLHRFVAVSVGRPATAFVSEVHRADPGALQQLDTELVAHLLTSSPAFEASAAAAIAQLQAAVRDVVAAAKGSASGVPADTRVHTRAALLRAGSKGTDSGGRTAALHRSGSKGTDSGGRTTSARQRSGSKGTDGGSRAAALLRTGSNGTDSGVSVASGAHHGVRRHGATSPTQPLQLQGGRDTMSPPFASHSPARSAVYSPARSPAPASAMAYLSANPRPLSPDAATGDLLADQAAAGDKKPSHGVDGVSLHSDGVLSFSSLNSLPEYGRLAGIAAALDPSNALPARIAAMDALQAFSPGDLTHSEHWQSIMAGLGSAIGCEAPHLLPREEREQSLHFQRNGLEYVWKLFRTSSVVSPVQTSELVLLVTTSCLQYNVVNYFRVTPQGVLDTQHPVGNVHLRKFRLLHKMYAELPNHWVHLPDQLYDQLIIGAFALLRTAKHDVPNPTTADTAVLTAAEVLALLDPNATWFDEWVCAARPREQVLRYVAQTGLLSDVVARCRTVAKVTIPRVNLVRTGTHVASTTPGATAASSSTPATAKSTRRPASTMSTYADTAAAKPAPSPSPPAGGTDGSIDRDEAGSAAAAAAAATTGAPTGGPVPVTTPAQEALSVPYATDDVGFMTTLQSMCILASVVSFQEGRSLFPVYVPSHSAAGLDATHVVRLAQLRGTRDRATNNRLRNLPKQNSTGLVGVGSGGVAATVPTSKLASLDDVLSLLRTLLVGRMVWQRHASRSLVLKLLHVCTKALVWVARSQPVSVADLIQPAVRLSAAMHDDVASSTATAPLSVEQVYALRSIGRIVSQLAQTRAGCNVLLAASSPPTSPTASMPAPALSSTSPIVSLASFASCILTVAAGTCRPSGPRSAGWAALLALPLAAVRPFLRTVTFTCRQPDVYLMLRHLGLPSLLARAVGALAHCQRRNSPPADLPSHSFLLSTDLLPLLLDMALDFTHTALGAWDVHACGLVGAAVRRLGVHFVGRRLHRGPFQPQLWHAATNLTLLRRGADAVANSPLLAGTLASLHILLQAPTLPIALGSDMRHHPQLRDVILPLSYLLTSPHALPSMLQCGWGGRMLQSHHNSHNTSFAQDLRLLATGGASRRSLLQVKRNLPPRLLSSFLRMTALPSSLATRQLLPCFHDTHLLGLALLHAACQRLDACMALGAAWDMRPRLLSLQGGHAARSSRHSSSHRSPMLLTDGGAHTHSARSSARRQHTGRPPSSIPFSPLSSSRNPHSVDSRPVSPSTPTRGSGQRSSTPTGGPGLTALTTPASAGGASVAGGRTTPLGGLDEDASIVDSDIEVDNSLSLFGDDRSVTEQLHKLGFTHVSAAGLARVAVLLRLNHPGGAAEALHLQPLQLDAAAVSRFTRLPCSNETLDVWSRKHHDRGAAQNAPLHARTAASPTAAATTRVIHPGYLRAEPTSPPGRKTGGDEETKGQDGGTGGVVGVALLLQWLAHPDATDTANVRHSFALPLEAQRATALEGMLSHLEMEAPRLDAQWHRSASAVRSPSAPQVPTRPPKPGSVSGTASPVLGRRRIVARPMAVKPPGAGVKTSPPSSSPRTAAARGSSPSKVTPQDRRAHAAAVQAQLLQLYRLVVLRAVVGSSSTPGDTGEEDEQSGSGTSAQPGVRCNRSEEAAALAAARYCATLASKYKYHAATLRTTTAATVRHTLRQLGELPKDLGAEGKASGGVEDGASGIPPTVPSATAGGGAGRHKGNRQRRKKPTLSTLQVPVDVWGVSRELLALLRWSRQACLRDDTDNVPSATGNRPPSQRTSGSGTGATSLADSTHSSSWSASDSLLIGSTPVPKHPSGSAAGAGAAGEPPSSAGHASVASDAAAGSTVCGTTSSRPFDWFVATLHLLVGATSRTRALLKQLSAPASAAAPTWLWPRCDERQLELRKLAKQAPSSVPPPHIALAHAVEVIMQEKAPKLFNAFSMTGLSVGHVVHAWHTQWFWNVLNFPDVARVLALVVLGGPHMMVFVCIALLTVAFKDEVLHQACSGGDVLAVLLASPPGPLPWRQMARMMRELASDSKVVAVTSALL